MLVTFPKNGGAVTLTKFGKNDGKNDTAGAPSQQSRPRTLQTPRMRRRSTIGGKSQVDIGALRDSSNVPSTPSAQFRQGPRPWYNRNRLYRHCEDTQIYKHPYRTSSESLIQPLRRIDAFNIGRNVARNNASFQSQPSLQVRIPPVPSPQSSIGSSDSASSGCIDPRVLSKDYTPQGDKMPSFPIGPDQQVVPRE